MSDPPSNEIPASPRTQPGPARSLFMSVRETAEYLQINEKKVYTLAAEGKIPGTKVTGKWLFPRDLVDQWLTQSSHGGVLSDRLVIAGEDDPLMRRLATRLCNELDGRALVAYSATGTRLGLDLLSAGRCDVALVNWGLVEESHLRHPALLRHYPEHGTWVAVRAFRREQGLMLAPHISPGATRLVDVLKPGLRLVSCPQGSGTGRFFEETMSKEKLATSRLEEVGVTHTSTEAAEWLRANDADATPACRAAAAAAGLRFVSAGWEAVDLVLGKSLYFRTLLQRVLDAIKSDDIFLTAERLGGYDFPDSGRLVWAAQG